MNHGFVSPVFQSGNVQLLKHLVENKANPLLTHRGETALWYAATRGHIGATEWLLKQEFPVAVLCHTLDECLCRYPIGKRRAPIVQLLLEHKAEPANSWSRARYRGASLYSANTREVATLLIAHGGHTLLLSPSIQGRHSVLFIFRGRPAGRQGAAVAWYVRR